MVTVLDTKIPAIVVSVLATYGKNVTVTVTTPGEPSADGGSFPDASSDTYTVKASPPYPVKQAYTLRDTTTSAEAAMLIAGSGLAFTPEVGNRVTIDGAVWIVESASPIYSGELVCAWELGLVRGSA